jgi:ferric-dicitrate binding protein FerR (iron transport regulator)
MANDRVDWEWLIRIRLGESTAEERAEFERWIEEDPSRAELMTTLAALDGIGSKDHSRWDTERGLARFKQLRSGAPRRRSAAHLNLSRPAPRPHLLRWAFGGLATAALALAVAVLPSRHNPRSVDQPSISKAPRETITGPGQRAVLDLSDGTHIVLAPESHLRVSTNFDLPGGRRELSLEGEAFLLVRHDTARPFLVRTPHGVVEDLGTEFAISTYPEIRGTRVAVRQGNAAVRPSSRVGTTLADTIAMLGPGDIALLSAKALHVRRNQKVSALFAGAEGVLVLDETLARAIPRLERWFGVRVRVTTNELLTRTIAADLRNVSATDGFAVIAASLKSSATWHQNEVTIASVSRSGEK